MGELAKMMMGGGKNLRLYIPVQIIDAHRGGEPSYTKVEIEESGWTVNYDVRLTGKLYYEKTTDTVYTSGILKYVGVGSYDNAFGYFKDYLNPFPSTNFTQFSNGQLFSVKDPNNTDTDGHFYAKLSDVSLSGSTLTAYEKMWADRESRYLSKMFFYVEAIISEK